MFIHYFFNFYKILFYPKFYLVGFKPFLFNFSFSFFFKSFKNIYIFRKTFLRVKFNFIKIYNFRNLKNKFNPSYFSSQFSHLKLKTFDSYYFWNYKKYIKSLKLYKWRVKNWNKRRVIKPLKLFKTIEFNDFRLFKSLDLDLFNLKLNNDLTFYMNVVLNKNSFFRFKRVRFFLKKQLYKNFNWKLTHSFTRKWGNFVSSRSSFFKLLKSIRFDNQRLIFKLKLKLSVFPFFFKIHKTLLKRYSKNFFNQHLGLDKSKFLKFKSNFNFFKYQPYFFYILKKKFNFYIKNPKRIKLKINYSVFWRKHRSLLKQVLFFKNKYQKQFTRFLINYNNISLKNFLLKMEFSLTNVLLRVKFFFFKNINFFFLENGYIYLNGENCHTSRILLFKNDVIQFIVSWRFFFFFKTQLNLFIFIKSKFRYKKWLYLNKNFWKNGKTRKYILPNWILKFNYFFEDIPLFFELDYQILMVILLFVPFNFKYFHFSHLHFVSLNSIKLYNWKYLT